SDQVNASYTEILAELERPEADLTGLSRRYQQVKALDYFQSERGDQVLQALLSARGGPRT
ncbi:MAG TPA: hypothetical protein VGK74_00695, partial [Symbiobacteriaceae bacterium]